MTGSLMICIASVAAMLASLAPFVADLHGRQLHTLPRAVRAVLGLVFLGISLVSGRAWYETTQHIQTEPTLQQLPGSSMTKEPSTFTVASSGNATASAPAITRSQARPGNVGTTARHDEITVAEQDRALPNVVAAADDALNALQSQVCTARGHLWSTQSQPDEGLRGLITTNLTLDVTLIDTQGVVRDAFTITSRGGGFTSESSALQARERLRDALHEHLKKEHP
jgi:hypothetical protein